MEPNTRQTASPIGCGPPRAPRHADAAFLALHDGLTATEHGDDGLRAATLHCVLIWPRKGSIRSETPRWHTWSMIDAEPSHRYPIAVYSGRRSRTSIDYRGSLLHIGFSCLPSYWGE